MLSVVVALISLHYCLPQFSYWHVSSHNSYVQCVLPWDGQRDPKYHALDVTFLDYLYAYYMQIIIGTALLLLS